MNPGKVEVSEMQGKVSPEAQEAAVRYANGDSARCEEILSRAIAQPGAGRDSRLVWLMLFELYRLQGRWTDFDELSRRFAAASNSPAPDWVSLQEENLPADLRRGGAGYCEISGELGASTGQVDAIRAAARQSVVHVDLTRIERILPEGCELLARELELLIANGNGVVFTGTFHLEKLLRSAVETAPKTGSCWRLLLDLYQLEGRQKQFESTALEYALNVEIDPPKWETVVMPVLSHSMPGERRNEPRYSQGREVLFLQGEMTGPNDAQLLVVRQFAQNHQYVNINLTSLVRIDFVCAVNLRNTLFAFANLGKVVRLIKPNLLVATLCRMLDVEQQVTLIVPNQAA
jgi:ABC-type transporter Mla MlaB component